MPHQDNIPEPGDDDEGNFVHMHIDFSGIEEADDDHPAVGMVHMHIHGVPAAAFVDTLLMLAVSVTASAMAEGEGPLSDMPDSDQKTLAYQAFARVWLSEKIKHAGKSGIMIHTPIPDDASSLFAEEEG